MISVKKRICALLCALLMLAGFVFGASASIIIEDESGTHYYDGSETPTAEATTAKPNAVSEAAQKALHSLSDFWRRYGVVTVIVLLLVAIVVAIVISEFERQKKEKRPPRPTSKKKKK